jgi:hypothetical protein
MNRGRLGVGTLVAGLWSIVMLAQAPPPDQAAVKAYRSAISAAEDRGTPRGIETAFDALQAMGVALRREQNGQSILESLSAEAFTELSRELKGVVITRDEAIVVEPDVHYFQTLAARRGDDADRAFFRALRATYPGSVWPLYIEQQTDVGGCTRFGSRSLVETYATWSAFQRRYARRYLRAASREAGAVLDALTGSTCACGTLPMVEQELRDALGAIRPSSARARVTRRLEDLRAGRSGIRPGCTGGL